MKKYILLLLFLFSACRPVATPATPAKPTSTSVPVLIKPTATATATPVSTATATPNPTPSSTARPERPLAQNGPWVFVSLKNTSFAINPDGTGYTQVKYELPASQQNEIMKVAGQGKTVAYVEGPPNAPFNDPEHIMLKIRTFPSNQEVSIPLGKSLKISAFTMTSDKTPYDQYIDNSHAIGELAWSPNGKYLAFTGAVDGPTSDVYVYSVTNGSIKRLSDSTSQAVYLHWSPDSRYLVYAAATSLNFGRSGGGYDLSALWAVNPDDGETKKLLNLSLDINILGWMDNSKLVMGHFGSGMDPYDTNLEIVDVNTKQVSTWLDSDFQVNAYDLQNKVLLFSLNNEFFGQPDPKHLDGTYLLTQAGPPQKVSDMKLARFESRWYSEIDRFLVHTLDKHTYAISPNGKIEKMPFLDSTTVIVSPDGKYWSGADVADADHSTFKIGDWNGQTWLPDTSTPGDYSVPMWSPDSQYCYLLTPENLYVMAAPDFKILNTIPIAPDEFYLQPPVWVAP